MAMRHRNTLVVAGAGVCQIDRARGLALGNHENA